MWQLIRYLSDSFRSDHVKQTWMLTGSIHMMSREQAAVLLLFNSADRLSYAEIKAQLNLTDEDMVRVLHSLSCARYKILKKAPMTDTVSPNDIFEFNSKFTDKMRRIKVWT